MSNQGYYRFPAIHQNTVYFVAEDDIWSVPDEGGVPRRLTAGLGEMGKMAVSPDGQWLAVTAREEKHTEVYVAPASGGPLRRLTYLGADCGVRGFTPEGEITFTSNAGQPFLRAMWMYHLPLAGGQPRQYPFGRANDLSFGPGGRMVIGRNTGDLARWKRYRGGTTGRLWVDYMGNGEFQPLLDQLESNIACPMWIGDRIYFLSDHEGIGNIYSASAGGTDVRRHTDHEQYFARWAATDGTRIVYQTGGNLHVFDPASGDDRRIEIEWHGPATQTQRKFVRSEDYLDGYHVHPAGHSIALDVRGKAMTLGFWDGPVIYHGTPDGVRYSHPQWLYDGKAIVTVSDGAGEERIELFHESGTVRRLEQIDLGRVVTMLASPTSPQIAVTNHRQELLLVDVDTETVKRLDHSGYRRITDLAWSPDGAWLACDFGTSPETTAIKVFQIATGRHFLATSPEFRDFAPSFDPEGKYLYFLSHRSFDPVYDSYYFDLGFPRSIKPCLVVLSADEISPFVAKPKGFSEEAPSAKQQGDRPTVPPKVRVDAEGIENRVLAFPVPEGLYRQIAGLPGKVLYTSFPIKGALNQNWGVRDLKGGDLVCYDFHTQTSEALASDVLGFEISNDGSTLLYRSGKRLRAVNAAAKIEKPSDDKATRQSGWVDLSRIRVSVSPRAEWKQMFRDIWRLQRDYFWSEDMSGVDWGHVLDRYSPLLDRVATRSEFSDLVWEMQGELGTSHAYEIGGDYRPAPEMPLGYLGADLSFDPAAGCYRIRHIVEGDSWDPEQSSPLLAPGANVHDGDRLLAINGRALSADIVPQSLLVNHWGVPIELTVANADGSNIRRVTVKTMRSESAARYREWVETNRRIVHEKTKGRAGYVHIPDMGPRGYAEFHRYYLLEAERPGLIIDVRWNGGGHVSQLILEKLGRKRVGYDFPRWGYPVPYPEASVLGPMVALTNEHAGSDGDMFSHVFKLMKLGPLVGRRTWGGVIGINPRHRLADGSMTTQPEFSFWFEDVGWGVENYGTDPDIDVEITPQDYTAGRDPQLDKAIGLVIGSLERNPPQVPDGSKRPRLPLPQLPRR